jgi:hypothetical protein
MLRTLEVRVIQDSINNQLRISGEIFKQIGKLADVAKCHNDNPELVENLREIMQSLLTAGRDVSENPRLTGEKLFDLLNIDNQ